MRSPGNPFSVAVDSALLPYMSVGESSCKRAMKLANGVPLNSPDSEKDGPPNNEQVASAANKIIEHILIQPDKEAVGSRANTSVFHGTSSLEYSR